MHLNRILNVRERAMEILNMVRVFPIEERNERNMEVIVMKSIFDISTAAISSASLHHSSSISGHYSLHITSLLCSSIYLYTHISILKYSLMDPKCGIQDVSRHCLRFNFRPQL